jgi:CubicO group peptidase (beta-lactamase class C family)
MRSRIIHFILLIAVSCSPRQKSTEQDTFDSFVDRKMREHRLVGLAAGIIVNKKLVWSKGFGLADRENKIPFTPNTIINIASITKTFTGACLMRAVEESKVTLDEDINTYLPFRVINPYFPEARITLRHLATHTAGITDRSPVYDDSYYYGGDYPDPLGVFLRNYFSPDGKYYSKENFLNARPGTRSSYSNIGAGLAGYIVEATTGKTLFQYGKENIFDPLKMENTGWRLSDIKTSIHSKLYDQKDDSIKLIPWYGLATYPDGGVRTSVSELSKFLICLLNEGQSDGQQVLKRESVREMTRPQFNESNKPDSLDLSKDNEGIFWWISQDGKEGHSGGDPGTMTNMQYDLKQNVGVILFINTTPKEGGKVFMSLDSALWSFAELWKKVILINQSRSQHHHSSGDPRK